MLGLNKGGTTRRVAAICAKEVLPESLDNFGARHVTRYRLELGVSDKTVQVIVVMFDETSIELVKVPAESILEVEDEVRL
ncbi:hypothetical protein Tco_0263296 [Tanacetum coccineum]